MFLAISLLPSTFPAQAVWKSPGNFTSYFCFSCSLVNPFSFGSRSQLLDIPYRRHFTTEAMAARSKDALYDDALIASNDFSWNTEQACKVALRGENDIEDPIGIDTLPRNVANSQTLLN